MIRLLAAALLLLALSACPPISQTEDGGTGGGSTTGGGIGGGAATGGGAAGGGSAGGGGGGAASCPAGSALNSSGTCAVCAPGRYCAGGVAASSPCVNSWDDDANAATACAPFSDCAAGTSVTGAGTATTDRACATCATGSFSSVVNAASCAPFRDCAAGTSVSTAGTSTTDRACAPCASDTFTSTTNAPSCSPLTVCAAGTSVTTAGTATSDRTCAACASGTFSSTTNAAACSPFTVCAAGTSVTTAGTAAADRVCTACASGTFSTTMNATTCSAWASCAAGNSVAVSGTTTSDRTCTTCASGTFSSTANAASCATWRACAPGTLKGAAGTATSDQVCTACASGTYSTTTNATSCTAWTTCAAGTFTSTLGSATSNQSCSACASGTYTSTSNAASCTAWSVCAADQFEQYPGSATTNRACTWVRQFGTAAADAVAGTAVDASGNIIVVGTTSGALQGFTNRGQADGFIRKYGPDGTVTWTDQFGGTGYDTALGVAVDASSNVYVSGNTSSTFPGQTLVGYNDVFVRKYDAAGAVQWTKQFGNTSPSGSVYGQAIALDALGNIFVGGSTTAAFPTTTQGAIYDGVLLKLDATGALVWVQQLQGSGNNPVYVNAVATDASDNIFVTGSTQVALPGQTLTGGPGTPDAFVRKYATSGTVLATAQFGTNSPTSGNGVAVDAAGNVFVAGQTYAAFPGYVHYGADGFVRKYDATLNALWLREVAANGGATGDALAVDAAGNVALVGTTAAVLTGQTNAGDVDVFVRSFDPSGTERFTYERGSPGADGVGGVALDGSGRIFIGGRTAGTWATQPANAGGQDAFVLRLLP